MLSKKNIKKEDQNAKQAKQAKQPKRMWAGKVPEHVVNQNANSKKNDDKPNASKIIYKGYTGDTAGIIIDTSAGKLSYKKQKVDEEEAKEQQNRKEIEEANQKLEQLKTQKKETQDTGGREIGETAIIQDDSDSDSDISPVVADNTKREIREEVESDDEDLLGDVEEENKEAPTLVIPDKLPEPEAAKEANQAIVSDDSSSDEEEEEESENEDEEMAEEAPEPVQPLLKPVFVKREERETIIEKEKKELEEQQKLEKEKEKQQEKIKQTQELVQKAIEDDNKSVDSEKDDRMPDDTDHPENELEEYEKWKEREFKRIKRDLEEREEAIQEQHEIERRRQLTDVEREIENKKLGSDKTDHKEGMQYNFMQKYYKLGPYFMDNAKKGGKYDILNRDYNAPLASEKIDVSTLPRVMQKRRGEFGKRGQSKWTHLTNEDTTNFDPTWKVPENIFKKTQAKLGGFKHSNDLDKPTRRRKLG